MSRDEIMRDLISSIYREATEFLSYTRELNQCAYTDRMVENIIEKADELKEAYNQK